MTVEKIVILSLIALNVVALGCVLWDCVQTANADASSRRIPLAFDAVPPVPADWQLTGDPLPPDQGWMPAEATAYCINGITRSGVYVRRGIIASDPDWIPLGSVVEIRCGRHSGIYIAMDTGSAVRGRIVDLYMESAHEAIQFGRRNVQLRMIRRGWEPVSP